MLSKQFEDLLSLVRLGIGHASCTPSTDVEWQSIGVLARKHGITAVILDGIERLPDDKRPPKELTLQWIGEVLQNYENRYELYCRSIAELAGFYNGHGYKMMVLKGYACSLDWPKPEHRPCGDIDIWVFGHQKFCDVLLSSEENIEVDYSHHHHTVFYWQGFMVENHYDFINIHHHKSNAGFEKLLKELGQDDSHYINAYGETIYLPSPNLHALFLLKHIMIHFAAEHVFLRQILDWAFFVSKHTQDVDWEWLEKVMDCYGMRPLYEIINSICIEDLGFNANYFPAVQNDPLLKHRVLNEILNPEFGFELPDNIFKRVVFKINRWYGSFWKHELCYNESRWSAFLSGVWNHMLKPSSI
jgi:hypothetical protein